jgi:hypothetical protein
VGRLVRPVQSHREAAARLVRPEEVHPEEVHREEVHPEAVHPEAAHPEAAHPEAAHPEAAHPEAAHPEEVRPEAAPVAEGQEVRSDPGPEAVRRVAAARTPGQVAAGCSWASSFRMKRSRSAAARASAAAPW